MQEGIKLEKMIKDIPWCRNHEGEEYSYRKSLELIRGFHGHTAPGLIVGVKMVALAMAHMEEDILFDVVCETRSCLPDAVQMLTLCTVGNGWLKIKDIGRYALNVYNKFEGDGVRVFIDSEKLKQFPEFYCWFYKIKPKKDQDFDLLMHEIKTAGDQVLSLQKIQIQPQYLIKQSKGKISTCPECGEAYPKFQGEICMGCQGETPYKKSDHFQLPIHTKRPDLKKIPADQAIGKRLVHDMTRIIPGKEKGAKFKKGQTILPGDICRLQKMGRQQIFVEDGSVDHKGWIHEDEAAIGFAAGIGGDGVAFSELPHEGKVKFKAERNGLLWVDAKRLEDFNNVSGVVCATRKSYSVVKKDESLAGSRAIPLFLSERDYRLALSLLKGAPLMKVLPMRKAKVGVLVTGTEIFTGLIQDSFIPIIQSKIEYYGCSLIESVIAPDDKDEICTGVRKILDSGVDLLVTTAGLSVDPDDVTRQGLVEAGCHDVVYGAPVLPGAMTLFAKIGKTQVIGVPACALYHKVTSFDLLLPRLLAGMDITASNLAEMGHGGFCMNCKKCVFPNCSYGK